MPRTPPFSDISYPTLADCARSCRAAVDTTGWGVSASFDIGMQPVSSLDYDDSPWPTELHRGFRHYIWDFGLNASVQDDYYWSLEPEYSGAAQAVISSHGFVARGMWGTGTDPIPSETYWATHSPNASTVSLLLAMIGASASQSLLMLTSPLPTSGLVVHQRAIGIYDGSDIVGVVSTCDYYRGTYTENPPYDESAMIEDGSEDVDYLYSPEIARIRVAIEEAFSRSPVASSAHLGPVWAVSGRERM